MAHLSDTGALPLDARIPTYPIPISDHSQNHCRDECLYPSRRPPLQTIPYDILHLVAQHLDYYSLVSICTLNRAFHDSLDPFVLASREAKRDFFLKLEQLPCAKDKLACFTCFQLLPKSSFGHTHAHGRRGKNGAVPELKGTRFCWECAAKHRLYPDLRAIKKEGQLWYLCHRCGEFKLRSQRCEKEYCSPHLTTGGNSAFENLSVGVQKHIFRLLEYRDAIRLAQTSRHFHDVLNPAKDTPIRSRYLFVRSLERPPVRWGCFSCSKVKPRDKFPDRAQFLTPWRRTWMRRCLACTQRQSIDTPEGRETLRRWRRHRLCRQCRTLIAEGEECEECFHRMDSRRGLKDEVLGWPSLFLEGAAGASGEDG